MSDRVILDNVSRFYGEVLGVNRVTLSVPAGITSLVGPNGSGKTTLMNLITGLVRPTRGEIRVLGISPTDPEQLFRVCGYATQFDSFPRGMTGFQFISSYLRLSGMSQADCQRTTAFAIGRVNLGDAAHRKIAGYSKGMRQRIKLAQAIAHEPELLILDEPLSGMDPLMRRRTVKQIKEWARAGTSVLVSSHILHEIEAMTSNIVLINNGRIVAEGDVHHIRDLIDEHPHTVSIRAQQTHAVARELLADEGVVSVRFEPGGLVVETARPDAFYARVTDLAASGRFGPIDEITSPDDNLQAVFRYLVKQ